MHKASGCFLDYRATERRTCFKCSGTCISSSIFSRDVSRRYDLCNTLYFLTMFTSRSSTFGPPCERVSKNHSIRSCGQTCIQRSFQEQANQTQESNRRPHKFALKNELTQWVSQSPNLHACSDCLSVYILRYSITKTRNLQCTHLMCLHYMYFEFLRTV